MRLSSSEAQTVERTGFLETAALGKVKGIEVVNLTNLAFLLLFSFHHI